MRLKRFLLIIAFLINGLCAANLALNQVIVSNHANHLFKEHNSTESTSKQHKHIFLILAQSESYSNSLLKKHLNTPIETRIFYLNRNLNIDKEKRIITYKNQKLHFDQIGLVYLRTMGDASAKKIGHRALKILQNSKIEVLDPLQSVLICDNKILQSKVFQKNNITTPKTELVFCGSTKKKFLSAICKMNKIAVVKTDGCGGNTTHFVPIDDEKQIDKIFNKYSSEGLTSSDIVIQQYIPCKNNAGFSYHYRIIVVNGAPIKTYRYTATSKEKLASNIGQGGVASSVDKDPFTKKQKEEIIRACLSVGTRVSGVDAILSDQNKLYILEVNNCPGLSNCSSLVLKEITQAIQKIITTNSIESKKRKF